MLLELLLLGILLQQLNHERLVVGQICQGHLGHGHKAVGPSSGSGSSLLLLLQEVECLYVLDVVLEHGHIVRMLLAGHVYAQIAGNGCLIATDIATERGLWFHGR